ncbi:GAG-pre-integrase domain-containing protein, partial [Escherichia coli]|uniref:GAG-pre-integrase domain-containing protein n=1 Tax=Escherichia coli TaxID=562 RepID=UPI003079206A
LVSVSKLFTHGYSVIFDSGVSIIRNDEVICVGTLYNSLYTISAKHNTYNYVASSSNPKKRKFSSQDDTTFLWHLRLGHINLNRIDHVCYTLQGFLRTRELFDGEITISMGNAAKVEAVAVGDVSLCFETTVLVLKDVLYVPDFRRNLVSVSKLFTHGYSVIFDSGVSIIRNDEVICVGT